MNNLLPDMCFIFSPDAKPGKYVNAVRYGESGCFATTYDEAQPKKAEALVAHMNQKLGVSDLQVECMLAGSMFGWDTPGADPAKASMGRKDASDEPESEEVESSLSCRP